MFASYNQTMSPCALSMSTYWQAANHECFDTRLCGQQTYHSNNDRRTLCKEFNAEEHGMYHGVGRNTYSISQGYKSVTWRLLRSSGESGRVSRSGIIGVVDALSPHDFARQGVIFATNHNPGVGVSGWHCVNGIAVFGAGCFPTEQRYEPSKGQLLPCSLSNRICGPEDGGDPGVVEINLNLETGSVVCTRISPIRHTHFHQHVVPVANGEEYRLYVEMFPPCADCFRLVSCTTEYMWARSIGLFVLAWMDGEVCVCMAMMAWICHQKWWFFLLRIAMNTFGWFVSAWMDGEVCVCMASICHQKWWLFCWGLNTFGWQRPCEPMWTQTSSLGLPVRFVHVKRADSLRSSRLFASLECKTCHVKGAFVFRKLHHMYAPNKTCMQEIRPSAWNLRFPKTPRNKKHVCKCIGYMCGIVCYVVCNRRFPKTAVTLRCSVLNTATKHACKK